MFHSVLMVSTRFPKGMRRGPCTKKTENLIILSRENTHKSLASRHFLKFLAWPREIHCILLHLLGSFGFVCGFSR